MLLLLCLFAFVAGLSNAAPVARIVDTHLPGGIRIVNDLVVIDEFHPFVKGVIDRAVEPYYQIIDHRFGKAKSLPITKAIEFFSRSNLENTFTPRIQTSSLPKESHLSSQWY